MRFAIRFQGVGILVAGIGFALTVSASAASPKCSVGKFERLPKKSPGVFRPADPVSYATALFQRIVGVAISPRAPLTLRMSELIAKGDYAGAARIALADRRFYSVRMRDFAAQYSNVDSLPTGEFDDLQALIIGIARDNLDARGLLTADYHYEGYPELGLPPVSRANNSHYVEFESRGFDPWKDLRRVKGGWSDFDEVAGALTTRAWGKAYYSAGTNRRSVKYAMQHFLCVQMEQWRDRALPDDYVRRDVDRNNAGNPENYQNKCRGCHSGMDAMAGAFSRFDFVGEELLQLPRGKVAEKYNQNESVYPEGYVTLDDSWLNYSTQHHNEALGWRGPLEGTGAAEYGKMLANTRAFSQCMTTRLFTELCNRAPEPNELGIVSRLADGFETGGYQIRSLVSGIAIEDACIAHPVSGSKPLTVENAL